MMHWLKTVAGGDPEMQDLMQSTGRRLVYATGGLYLVAHMIATLGYPAVFSPSLWAVTLYMLALVTMALRVMERRYLLGQLLWLAGLAGAVLLAFSIYGHYQICFLLIVIPLMAVISLGVPVAALFVVLAAGAAFVMLRMGLVPAIVPGGVLLGGMLATAFGWNLSSSLSNALDAASYHYREARRLLDETRNHRAEISRILKDRNQVNYQLERMNEMLSFARAQAEEARENRTRFMLAVSHELRSPLNFIIGFSDLMVNSPETYAPREQWPPGLYDDVQEVFNSSRHLMRLINDILDMGKIEAGQMALYREKAPIEQIVDDVRAMLGSAFEQKGIELRLEIHPGLPPVFIDTTRIRQVLLNLLNNGLRFTEKGSVTLEVEKQEKHLLISVRDTGRGIAPEDLPKMFDEFRQVGEENWRRRAGTGLGLYISRQFVELHGGEMGVESRLGEGTRFHFTLPLETTLSETPSSTSGGQPSGRPLILMIAPRADEVTALRPALDGYLLQATPNPEEARRQARELFPRAILIPADAGEIQPDQLPYDLPVVRFSLPRPAAEQPSLAAHLVKPVTRQVLLAAIRALGPQAQRLLVVDDDPAMVRFVTQSIRAEGEYTLRSAHDAAGALALLEREPVDAILLDLELPDLHGWDLLKRLQTRPRLAGIPVIVITAQDRLQETAPARAKALELTMRRPLQAGELGGIVKAVLENILPQYPRDKQ